MEERAECFGGYNPEDKACVDPEKGPCGSSVICQKASAFTGNKWWKNISAQKQAEVEAALIAPPPSETRSRPEAPPPAQQAASGGAGGSLENELDAELGNLGAASSAGEAPASSAATADPPPASTPAKGKGRRGRKSNAQKEAENKQAEESAKANEALEQRDDAQVDKAEPVEKVATEILSAGLQKQFGILFNPLFQQLIPDALAARVNLLKNEGGSVTVLIKDSTANIHPYLREAAVVSPNGDGLLVCVPDNDPLIVGGAEGESVGVGTDAIIVSISRISKLLSGCDKAENNVEAPSRQRQGDGNGRKKRKDAGQKRGKKKGKKKKAKKRK